MPSPSITSTSSESFSPPWGEALHAVIEQGEDAAECFAHADRPGDRGTVDLQNIFNLAEQVNRILNLAVEFVDERNDRSLAHTADFEQFDGLSFHALGEHR